MLYSLTKGGLTMPMYNNICKVCGKAIHSYMSNKLVCSKECRKIANREYAREFMRLKRQGYKFICIDCKKEVIAFKSGETICLDCQVKSQNRKEISVQSIP